MDVRDRVGGVFEMPYARRSAVALPRAAIGENEERHRSTARRLVLLERGSLEENLWTADLCAVLTSP